MSFSVNVTINENFYRKTNVDVYKQASRNTINRIVIDAEEECMRECPVRTGNLRASHYIVFDGESSAKIMNSAEYASDVIYGNGTRPPNDYPQRALNNLNGAYDEVFIEMLASMGVMDR